MNNEENYNILNYIRLFISCIILGISFYISKGIITSATIIAMGCVLFSLVWLVLEKTKLIFTPKYPFISYFPTIVDLVLVTYFVYITGGISSPLIIGYYFIVSVCSMSIRTRLGLFASILSSLGLLALGFLGYREGLSLFKIILTVSLNTLAFFLIYRLVLEQVSQTNSLIVKLENSEKTLSHQNNTIQRLLSDFESKSNDWFIDVDLNLVVTYLSTQKMSGLESYLKTGAYFLRVLYELVDSSVLRNKELYDVLESAIKEQKDFRTKELSLNLSDRHLWVEFSGYPLSMTDQSGTGWRIVGNDISEKKEMEYQLFRKANFDEKTALPNLHRFHNDLETIQDIDFKKSGILGIIQIGNLGSFRLNTDSAFINHIIFSFINRFKSVLGEDVYLARSEYDEFYFFMEKASLENIEKIHDFKKSMQKALRSETERIYINMYMGIAFYPEDGDNLEKLIKAANIALINSYSTDGNRVIRYSDLFYQKFQKRMQLVHDFPSALANHNFYIAFQPQFNSSDLSLYGAEALVRWNHSERGFISPGEFIPLAEQYGFIIELGEWVMIQSCIQANLWPVKGVVSVNISPLQLKNLERLRHIIKKALTVSSLPPERLIIEITESEIFFNDSDIKHFIEEVHKMGIRIALDDFGTGYSSLSILQEICFDELKIDQAFVKRLEDKKKDAFIETIIKIGKLLNTKIVAEGVEEEFQAEYLKKLGCDIFQGYLYGKPEDSDTFIKKFM